MSCVSKHVTGGSMSKARQSAHRRAELLPVWEKLIESPCLDDRPREDMRAYEEIRGMHGEEERGDSPNKWSGLA